MKRMIESIKMLSLNIVRVLFFCIYGPYLIIAIITLGILIGLNWCGQRLGLDVKPIITITK